MDNQELAETHQEISLGMAALLQAMQQQAAQQQQHREEQQQRYQEQLALYRRHQVKMMQMMERFFLGGGRTLPDLASESQQQDRPHHEISDGKGPGQQIGGGHCTAQGNEHVSPAEAHVDGNGTETAGSDTM